MSSFVFSSIVSQYGQRVYAHLQPHLHDAAHWALVRLPPVPRSDAPGFPSQFLGGHQRTPGTDDSIDFPYIHCS